MSDMSIYELEDIIWDDFDRNGDHIVPHPNKDDSSEKNCEGGSCKKPRHEVKDEKDPDTLNKEKNMLEKDSWGVFAASGDADSANDTPTLQSGDAKLSSHSFKSSNVTSESELCTDDGILKDTPAVGDSNSYNYPQNNIRESDVNLFSNNGDDKESSDLLYYGWPDIGNFDDVDRMLSNCDSSFGLGVTGNDDELVWFTSEDPGGGYEQPPIKMDLKFPCTETNVSQNNQTLESDNKRSRMVSESKDEFNPKDNKGSSIDYIQNNTYMHPAGTMMTGVKFENKGPAFSSPKETSNVSMETENYGRFQASSSGNGKQMDMNIMIRDSGSDLISSQKKIESQNEIGGSLDVPEGSSISTELDEISLEATSFRQLQQVMEQLDARTKLCIRDSLYRLARSAEQRHNHAGITDPANCGPPGGPLITDGTNTGFMDMETDTNPIDRTIAHLLFHRPSESFKMPTTTSSLKPNTKVHGLTMVTEKVSCQETRNESNDKVSSSEKN